MLNILALAFLATLIVAAGQLLAWIIVGFMTEKDDE